MKLSSPAFEDGASIPDRYTCEGADLNPPLIIDDIPGNARSLCIIMHDPDSPHHDFVHWVAYNIAPTRAIADGASPGTQGVNDSGGLGYYGPCPSKGVHRYVIEVHALDAPVDLPAGKTRRDVERAMQSHTLATAELMGRFGMQ